MMRGALRRSIALGLLAFDVACAPPGHVALPIEGIPVDGTIVVSFVDQSRRVFVSSPADALVLRTDADELFVLGYEESPESLKLPRGELVGDHLGASCRVLSPSQAHRFAASEDWVEVSPASSAPRAVFDALLPDRDPRCERCPSLETSRLLVPEPGRVEGAARLDSGSLFLSNLFGLYVADGASVRRLEGCQLAGIQSTVPLGADRFWAGKGGQLVRVSVDEASARCTLETSTTTPGRAIEGRRPEPRWLAEGEDPESVYALTDDGKLHLFDGSAWTLLAELEFHPSDRLEGRCHEGGLVRLGPADLVFHCGWNQIARWSRGTVQIRTVEMAPPTVFTRDGKDRLSMLAKLPEFGLLVSDLGGWIYRVDEDLGTEAWLTFPEAVGAARVYGEGMAVSLNGGRVSHWHPDLGTCPTPIEILHSRSSPGYYLFVDGWDVRVADFAGDNDSQGGVDSLTWKPR